MSDDLINKFNENPISTVLELAEKMGAAKALNMIGRTSDIAQITFFRNVHNLFKSEKRKEIKKYFPNFQSVCESFNVSYSKIMEEIQNIEALGQEFYEALKSLGAPRDMFREIRMLPENVQDEVKLVIESPEAAGPDMVKDVIEKMVEEKRRLENEVKERDRNLKKGKEQFSKIQSEKEQLEEQIKKLEGNYRPETEDDKAYAAFVTALDGSVMAIESHIEINWERFQGQKDKLIRLNALLRAFIATLQKLEAEQAQELGEDVIDVEIHEFRASADEYFNAAHNVSEEEIEELNP